MIGLLRFYSVVFVMVACVCLAIKRSGIDSSSGHTKYLKS